ncbi:MAG: hypothetical protein INR65_12905 [Gluconacetobacter diazotrophicus]|nr:hypothetical protein [Gluconacetobacter diazotrophicus]
MSGAQGIPNLAQPQAQAQVQALLNTVVRNMPTIAGARRRLRSTRNAITGTANAAWQPVRSTSTAAYDAASQFVSDAAQDAVDWMDRLYRAADRIIREQQDYVRAGGQKTFDPTAIALEVFGIGGGIASRLVPPGGKPYFAVLPGAAAAVEVKEYYKSGSGSLGDINGKPNPVLVEYYIANGRDVAALRSGNGKIQRYLENRHSSNAQGAAAGFVAVVTGLITTGKVGPFINAGLHGKPLFSTAVHLGSLVRMRTQNNVDPQLKGWLNLLIEIKTVKAGIRANLVSLSLPWTADSVWYQLIGASAVRLAYRPRLALACCIAAADLHARAHIELGLATAAAAPPPGGAPQVANQQVPAGRQQAASFMNQANALPALPAAATATQPATEIIVELFSKFGRSGTTDPMDIIAAPAGWIAIVDKMMLM